MSGMSRRSVIWLLVGTLAVILTVGTGVAAYAAETLKIGAILTLSGPKAVLGEEEKRGIEMAVERINANGGVLKKKVEMIIEDDQFRDSVTISAVEKLVNKDKVVAITGGYSSGGTLAFLSAMRKYGLVSSWQGGGAIKIDEKYGKEPWFFMYHPRSPDYQEVITNFLAQIPNGPKTVAITYEDSSYGVDHSKSAKKFFTQKGLKVVLMEPFKSGAIDYAPLVTKVKSVDPDVFYFICYTGDAQLITKQSKELGYNPKLFLSTVGVGVPEFQSSLKASAEYVSGIEVWIPGIKFPASKKYPKLFPSTDEWVKSYVKKFKRNEPNYWSAISYVSLMNLCTAINSAGTTDTKKVIAAMEATDTMTPMGPLKFFANPYGALHQSFKEMIVFQWQNGEKVALWPKNMAEGKVIYPTPAWDKRPALAGSK